MQGESIQRGRFCVQGQTQILQATLSVTASPCHLSRKGEALARAKSFALISWLLLPLAGVDETCWFCQGLALRESCRRRRLRGFVPESTLSGTASPCHLSRKGEALAKARGLRGYRSDSSSSRPIRMRLSLFAKGSPFGRAVERSETERVLPPSPGRRQKGGLAFRKAK